MDDSYSNPQKPSVLMLVLERRLFWFVLFFLLFFTTQMTFRGSDIIAGGTTDLQVFIRLGVLCGAFGVTLLFYKDFFRLLREIPMFSHFLLLLFLFVVTLMPWAFSFYTIYALMTHFIMFYIVAVMVARLGLDQSIYFYVCGVAIFCVVSLVFYYAVPQVGRYWFWNESGVYYQSARMSGIAGHPNTLGFMAATGILGFLHLKFQNFRMSAFLYPGVFIVLICLVLTDSRTSLFGMILMVGMYIVLYLRMVWVSILLAVAACTFLLLSLEFSWGIVEEVLTTVSRSGKIEEVTSLTGRSYVWDQMFVMIERRPVIGHGHATMSKVLAMHQDEIGFEAGQAHNLYLQILFSGGIVGLFLYILNILAALWPASVQAFRDRRPYFLCIIFYILIASFTESIMLSSVANNAYLLFTICLTALSLECSEKTL